MTAIYPLKAVVTSNKALAADYNRHDVSVFLTSGCLSPEEFGSLVEDGAQFESVVLVDGAGEHHAEKLAGARGADVTIERIGTGTQHSMEAAIEKIHAALGCSGNQFDVGG